MTRPVAVVFETQREFTALAAVIAELGDLCFTVQVERPDTRTRSRGFLDGGRLVEPDVKVGPERLAPVLADLRPGALLIVGDSDTSVLAAGAAAASNIPMGRLVEDGGQDVPPDERPNGRALADLATTHFVASEGNAWQLESVGVTPDRVVVVGDLTPETTRRLLPSEDEREEILEAAGLRGDHIVVAINKPENVDDPDRLRFILRALAVQDRTVAMPLNPHVSRRIHEFGLVEEARALTNLKLVDRATFLAYVWEAGLVVSDVGAVLREAATLRVPAVLLAAHDPSPWSPEWISDDRFAHRVAAGAMLSAHLRAALDDRTWADRLRTLHDPIGDGLAGRRVSREMLRLSSARPPAPVRTSNAGLNAGSGP